MFNIMSRKKLLILLINYNCNNNCRFCMIPPERKKDNFMPFSIIRKKIDAIKEEKTIIDFIGGEPTIHPEFFSVLEYAKNRRCRFLISTNARIFSYEKNAARLGRLEPVIVRSSLHGHAQEFHEFFTRAAGSFKQTITGFRNILKHNIPLSVNIVMNKKNLQHLINIVHLLTNLGVKNIRFLGLNPTGNMRINENRALIADFPLIKKFLLPAARVAQNRGVVFRFEKIPICLIPEMSDYFIEEYDKEPYTHNNKCSLCKFNRYCAGIQKGYNWAEIKFKPAPIYENKKS